MMTIRSWAAPALASLLLVACGGNDDAPAARGTIVSAQLLGRVTKAEVDIGTAGSAGTPKRPGTVALCGGAQDPTIFFFNATDMQIDLASRNFLVPAWDLESRASLPAAITGDQIYGGFQAQKTAAGANAVAQYQGTLVPPFCTALVRGLFQQVLAAGI